MPMAGPVLAPAEHAWREDDLCYICLESHESEHGALQKVCGCPRGVHPKCLARWQLQQAGKEEEQLCRFCKQRLPDWKQTTMPETARVLPAPLVIVSFQGRIARLQVHPGPGGKEKFQQQIREAFGLPDDQEVDVTFGCRAPITGERVQLHGMDSFGAAMHCASLAAGKRLARRAAQLQEMQLLQDSGISYPPGMYGRAPVSPAHSDAGSSNHVSGGSQAEGRSRRMQRGKRSAESKDNSYSGTSVPVQPCADQPLTAAAGSEEQLQPSRRRRLEMLDRILSRQQTLPLLPQQQQVYAGDEEGQSPMKQVPDTDTEAAAEAVAVVGRPTNTNSTRQVRARLDLNSAAQQQEKQQQPAGMQVPYFGPGVSRSTHQYAAGAPPVHYPHPAPVAAYPAAAMQLPYGGMMASGRHHNGRMVADANSNADDQQQPDASLSNSHGGQSLALPSAEAQQQQQQLGANASGSASGACYRYPSPAAGASGATLMPYGPAAAPSMAPNGPPHVMPAAYGAPPPPAAGPYGYGPSLSTTSAPAAPSMAAHRRAGPYYYPHTHQHPTYAYGPPPQIQQQQQLPCFGAGPVLADQQHAPPPHNTLYRQMSGFEMHPPPGPGAMNMDMNMGYPQPAGWGPYYAAPHHPHHPAMHGAMMPMMAVGASAGAPGCYPGVMHAPPAAGHCHHHPQHGLHHGLHGQHAYHPGGPYYGSGHGAGYHGDAGHDEDEDEDDGACEAETSDDDNGEEDDLQERSDEHDPASSSSSPSAASLQR